MGFERMRPVDLTGLWCEITYYQPQYVAGTGGFFFLLGFFY